MSHSTIPKASDVVVSAIRNRIIAERLPVDTRLPSESELMEEYGLGRVTVREALRILERDGLVNVRRGPTGGIFVRHTDVRQVSDAVALLFGVRGTTLGEFADFRLRVEPRAAALAARNATDKQRQQLLDTVAAENETSRTADMHSMIAEMSGNDVFDFAIKALHASLVGHFRYELIHPEHVDTTHRAHLKIVKTVCDGDATGAEGAMQRHLEQYAVYLQENGLENESIITGGR